MRLDRANTLTGGFEFRGIARLKPGVTLSQANDDIASMIPIITEQFPLEPGVTPQMWKEVGLAPNVRPLSEDVTGDVSRPLWILLGTAGIVLLIAWTNVANLLLVRAESRLSELAVEGVSGLKLPYVASFACSFRNSSVPGRSRPFQRWRRRESAEGSAPSVDARAGAAGRCL